MAGALSIDALFAGIAYGGRKVTIPWSSAVFAGALSGGGLYGAMAAGQRLGDLMPASRAAALGGLLLIGLGLLLLFRSRKEARIDRPDQPDFAWPDFDGSGHISMLEAVWLGMALMVDGLGAGLAMGLGRWDSTFLPLLVTGATVISLMAGFIIGRQTMRQAAARFPGARIILILPGGVLIIMGTLRLLMF